MSETIDKMMDSARLTGRHRDRAATASESAHDIPVLVSELYEIAPAPLRTKMLECLLRPVGPLAIVAIASGAFAHLLYRLRLNGIPVSLADAAPIGAAQVLDLARFVEQCSPDALLKVFSLIPDNPIGFAANT